MADPNNIIDLLFNPDQTQAAAAARAAAAQIRGQTETGELGYLAGGRRGIAALGPAEFQSANEGQNRLVGAAQAREQMLLRQALGFGRLGVQEDIANKRNATTLEATGMRGETARDVQGMRGETATSVGAGHDAARIAAARLMGDTRLSLQDRVQGLKGALSFGKAVDPDTNPGLKPYRDMVLQADRLHALASMNGGNLTPAQMEEFALGLHRMFTGGSRAIQAQVAALVPSTISGDVAKFLQYVKGIPQGAQQQEFVKLFDETARREAEVAQGHIKEAQKRGIATNLDFLARYPEHAMTIMQEAGIKPEDLSDMKLGGGSAPLPNLGVHPVPPPGGAPGAPPAAAGPTDEEILNKYLSK